MMNTGDVSFNINPYLDQEYTEAYIANFKDAVAKAIKILSDGRAMERERKGRSLDDLSKKKADNCANCCADDCYKKITLEALDRINFLLSRRNLFVSALVCFTVSMLLQVILAALR